MGGYRGEKHHLKRVHAPKQWCLKKMGGNFAPRPSHGPHKVRECLPMAVLLRNRLKYALTYNEVKFIVMQRLIKVDGKVRTDTTYPVGFQDVVTIDKTKANYRLMYDTKGRFVPHKIRPEEANYKLCKIKRTFLGSNAVPYAVTHDGRTIRYVHPEVKPNDTVIFNIETGKMADSSGNDDPWIKFQPGNMAMITGGNNIGRVGTIVDKEAHPGSIAVVHIKDPRGQTFATRIGNVFVIGKGNKPWVSLPKGEGVKLTILEDRKKRLEKQAAAKSS